MEKSQSARDRERRRLIRRLNELDENENWPSGPDGRPLMPVPFPRPYMMAQGISERLRIDPEHPGLNPLCRCLNALWDDVNWELNIALHQRIKWAQQGEIWQKKVKGPTSSFGELTP
jgi:hypothetical protein